jgi:hypothetical protein
VGASSSGCSTSSDRTCGPYREGNVKLDVHAVRGDSDGVVWIGPAHPLRRLLGEERACIAIVQRAFVWPAREVENRTVPSDHQSEWAALRRRLATADCVAGQLLRASEALCVLGRVVLHLFERHADTVERDERRGDSLGAVGRAG